jgi:L-lactate dehydrogenase complex protein LldG
MAMTAVDGGAAAHGIEDLDAAIEQIAALVSPLGVTHERVRDLRGAARAVRALQEETGAETVLVPGELVRLEPAAMTALEDAGVAWRVPEDLAGSRDQLLGVSLAEAALVETGSVLLAERSLADRGIGLVTLTQIVLIPVDRIIPGLDEAAVILARVGREGGYATLVTGPSRTADIEMSLTVGVQGPGRVHYLFVDALR